MFVLIVFIEIVLNMKRDYIVSIENPCEKILWSSMEKSDSGKFCDLCSKNVVDFSVLSDAEIIKIIENPSRDICAKMSPLQTNRLLSNPSKIKNFHLSKTITTLLLVGSVKGTFASEQNLTKQNQIVVNSSFNSIQKFPAKAETDSLKKTISGSIINENTDETLDYEYVFIEGTNISTATDTLGNFTLNVPDDFTADEIILVLKATGWESDTRTIVYRKDLPVNNLIIKKESPIVGEYIIKIKRKWWQFWKKKYY